MNFLLLIVFNYNPIWYSSYNKVLIISNKIGKERAYNIKLFTYLIFISRSQ